MSRPTGRPKNMAGGMILFYGFYGNHSISKWLKPRR